MFQSCENINEKSRIKRPELWTSKQAMRWEQLVALLIGRQWQLINIRSKDFGSVHKFVVQFVWRISIQYCVCSYFLLLLSIVFQISLSLRIENDWVYKRLCNKEHFFLTKHSKKIKENKTIDYCEFQNLLQKRPPWMPNCQWFNRKASRKKRMNIESFFLFYMRTTFQNAIQLPIFVVY